MAVIAPPMPDIDIEEWAAQQLEEPFTDWDVNNHGWMQTKLAHCVGLPVNVQWALDLARDYGLPALAGCSAEDILEALSLIAPCAVAGQIQVGGVRPAWREHFHPDGRTGIAGRAVR